MYFPLSNAGDTCLYHTDAFTHGRRGIRTRTDAATSPTVLRCTSSLPTALPKLHPKKEAVQTYTHNLCFEQKKKKKKKKKGKEISQFFL